MKSQRRKRRSAPPDEKTRASEASRSSKTEDELLEDAIQVVREEDQASISLLQQRLSLGVNRAARVLDRLEEIGVIGPAQGGTHRRAVLSQDQGRSLEDLNEALGRDPEGWVLLSRWVAGIPEGFGYHLFKIRKRTGGGHRQICAPNELLRRLQRSVYSNLLRDEALPRTATGFVVGRSIVHNALPHVDQAVVVNIDLKDFFDNTKEHRVFRYWFGQGWDLKAARVLTNICCYKGRLPQGAPTSPALSNVVNRFLDSQLERLARKLGGRYTRYADDLTFSFQGKFGPKQRKLIPALRAALAKEGYEIQTKKKVRIQRTYQRQTVTGLVVNTHLNLPRATRRKIRAMQHHQRLGRLSKEEEPRLAGYEALLRMVETGRGSKPHRVPSPGQSERPLAYGARVEASREVREPPQLYLTTAAEPHIKDKYLSSIIAICDDHTQPVGTGFLAFSRDTMYVVTCAHVIAPMKKGIGAQVVIKRLTDWRQDLTGVVHWLPTPANPNPITWEARDDICVLRLYSPLPELSADGILPLADLPPKNYLGWTGCWCFGFPKSKGLRGDEIGGLTCESEVALGYVKLFQPEAFAAKGTIEEGVSGAPLCAPQGHLIGMINATYNRQVVYLIPSLYILEVIKALPA